MTEDWRARLAAWTVRGCMAAVVLTVFESLFVVITFPPATSDLLGFVGLVVQTVVIHTFAALPMVLIGALLLERSCARLAWPDPAQVTAVCLGIGLATYLLHLFVETSAEGQHRQFPDRLVLIQIAGIVAILIGSFVVSLCLRPALKALFKRLPVLSRPRPVLVAAGAAFFLLAIGTIYAGFAAVHLDLLIGPFGVILAGLLTVMVRLTWIEIGRRVTRMVLIVWALLLLGLPIGPWHDPHTRSVLYAHTPIAGSLARHLRNWVDIDGDGTSPTWLGGTDCAELDSSRGPMVREVAGDGIDQDCTGGDAHRRRPATPSAPPSLWSSCPPTPSPLSVVLITIDALRADMLGPRVMPNLSRFAAHCTRFTRAYAPATFTATSMVSIFGAGPLSDLGPPNLLSDRPYCLAAPIAERLRQAGYHTAYINPLGTSEATRQGFEQASGAIRDPLAANVGSYLFSAATADDALAYLVRHRAEKVFLWTHFLDPHAPYREPYRGRFRYPASTSYGRLLAYVDAHVGRLLSELRRIGLASRTMVIITADHGEDLGRCGREGHGPNLFEDTIHVPLLVWVPGCRPRTVSALVSSTQIGPTIGQLVGVTIPGTSLSTDDRPVVAEALFEGGTFPTNSFRRAILWRQYKLIVDVRNGGRLLFDLAQDRAETVNIYRRRPKAAEQMERFYQRWLDRPRPPWLDRCKPASTKVHGERIAF